MAYATVDELAGKLRITVTAANTAALQNCLDAATVEIDHTVDAPPTATPYWSDGQLALLNVVNLARSGEWWKANDAAWGVLGFDEIGALRLPRSTFARHAIALMPLTQRFGCA